MGALMQEQHERVFSISLTDANGSILKQYRFITHLKLEALDRFLRDMVVVIDADAVDSDGHRLSSEGK